MRGSQWKRSAPRWARRSPWRSLASSGRRWPWRRLSLLLAAAVVIPWMGHESAEYLRWRASRAAIEQTRRAIERFRTEIGRCPRSDVELVHPPRPLSLELREIPRDGWGHPLWIACPGRLVPDEPDVVSAGPSGDFLIDDNLY